MCCLALSELSVSERARVLRASQHHHPKPSPGALTSLSGSSPGAAAGSPQPDAVFCTTQRCNPATPLGRVAGEEPDPTPSARQAVAAVRHYGVMHNAHPQDVRIACEAARTAIGVGLTTDHAVSAAKKLLGALGGHAPRPPSYGYGNGE